VEDSGRLAKVTRIVRGALAELFDQSKPFGRLALVHTIQAAGSTFIAISLAGSLFFSISPHAAEGKVLLYLLLTIAPFAVVGPALSPLLDRGRQARRTSVAIANGGSALLCLAMARDVHNLFLFPEAFGVLVLAKLYLVARAALVPEVAGDGDDLASANAKLAVLASLAGFAAFPLGVGLLKIGAPWVLRFGTLVFLAGMLASFRLPRPRVRHGAPAAAQPASATGPTAATDRPAAAAGAVGGATSAGPGRPPRLAEVAHQRRLLGLALYPPPVLAAISAMTVARGTVGFVTFFLAFGLRRAHAGTWWFGLLIAMSGIGSLAGAAIVPRLRRRLTERQIIASALVAIATGATVAALINHLWAEALLTLVVGIGPTSAKAALDSIVQRHVPPALLGRAFGRLETRLQLAWVLAALVAVVIPFPLQAGDIVVAVVCVLAAASYITAFAAGRRRRAAKVARAGDVAGRQA
jgi:hypothetical protein